MGSFRPATYFSGCYGTYNRGQASQIKNWTTNGTHDLSDVRLLCQPLNYRREEILKTDLRFAKVCK